MLVYGKFPLPVPVAALAYLDKPLVERLLRQRRTLPSAVKWQQHPVALPLRQFKVKAVYREEAAGPKKVRQVGTPFPKH